jgi:carbonic anhydrase/acetyltransferase-like protein (isoleucine patch superfamily)
MTLYTLDHLRPEIHETAWVADSAQVIGRVVLEAETSIWFGAVARADSGDVMRIGRGSNAQEHCVLHADPGFPLTIGENVTVGHKAMLHGCTVGDGSLIGIGAIVLNGAVFGRNCLVGAGALVTEGKTFPDGSMILGSPAKVVKMLSPEQIEGLARSAAHYRQNARRFRLGLKAAKQP